MSNILDSTYGPDYATQSLEEKALRAASRGCVPWPTKTPKAIRDAAPAEAAKLMKAVHKAERDYMSKRDNFTVDRAGEHHERARKAAVEKGDASLAPATLNHTKETLRAVRRELDTQFKQQYREPWVKAAIEVGTAVLGAYEKLIIAEDDAEAKRLANYGIPQVGPCKIVRSLLSVRNYIKARLQTFHAMLESSEAINQFQTDPDFARVCGVDV